MESDNHLLKVGEFVLNTDSRKLFDVNNREVLLSPTLYALLKYFIEHQNQILTKESIISHVWKGKIVVEANVNQNIKKLRDTLGDSALTPKYIETVTGEGFRFIANSAEYRATPDSGNAKQSYILSAAMLLVTIVVIIWTFVTNDSGSEKSTLKVFHPLTTLKGIELYPTVSPDKRFLLFNHKDPSSPWNVFIKPLDRESYHLLLDSEYDELFPTVSPDGKKLMYHSYGVFEGQEKCGIFVRDIDLDRMSVGEEYLIKKCFKMTERLRAEWISNKEIFLAINEELTSPASIYYYNIENNTQKLVSRPDSKGFGDYVFKYSAELRKLAYVRNIGWSSSEIWVYDLKTETHSKIKSVPLMIRGIDWQANWIYFQSGSRAISKINDAGNKEELVATTTSSLYVPFVINDQKIGVVQGDVRIVDISRINLVTKNREFLINSSFNDYYGVPFGNEVAFVSNRSGDPQVWLRTSAGEFSQLTHFDSSFELKWLSSFTEENLLMFNRSGETIIISSEGEVVFSSKDYSNQTNNNPVFDKKNRRILYSRQYNGEWTIESRSLAELGKTSLLFKGVTAKPCYKEDCILYFKEKDNTLYKYDAASNSSVALIELSFIRRSDQWEIIDNDNILYLEESEGRNNSLYQANIRTGSKELLLRLDAKDFAYDKLTNSILANVLSQGNTDIAYFNIF